MPARIASRSLPVLSAIALALAAGCQNCKCGDKSAEPAKPTVAAAPTDTRPLTYEDNFNATVTATVKSVDQSTRQLTLVNTSGGGAQEMTYTVDPSVQRLNEIKPGDRVTAKYRARLLAELRPPTAAEAARPIAYADASARAPRSEDPAAAGAQAVRIVTTVEAVDVPNKLVTLRGPLGDLAVVKGRNTENLKRINRGDTIVITFDHVLAVAVDKP